MLAPGESQLTIGRNQQSNKGNSPLRIVKVAVFSASILLLIAFGVLTLGYLTAPTWIKKFAEDKISTLTGGHLVELGDVSLILNITSLNPSVRVKSANISDVFGLSSLELTEIQIDLNLLKALSGELKANSISVGSAQINADFYETALNSLFLTTDNRFSQQFNLFELWAASSVNELEVHQIEATLNIQETNRILNMTDGNFIVVNNASGIDVSGMIYLGQSSDTKTVLSTSFQMPTDFQEISIGVELQGVNPKYYSSLFALPKWMETVDLPIDIQLIFESESGVFQYIQWWAEGQSSNTTIVENNSIPHINSFVARGNYQLLSNRLQLDEAKFISSVGDIVTSGYIDIYTETSGIHYAEGRLDIIDALPKKWAWLFEDGRSVSGNIDFHFDFNSNDLEIVQLVVNADETTIITAGQLDFAESSWKTALEFQFDAVSRDNLIGRWGGDIKNWLNDRLIKGHLVSGSGGIIFYPKTESHFISNFEFADVTLEFIENYPPLMNAYGFGIIENDSITLVVEAGSIEDRAGHHVNVEGSTILFQDITTKRPSSTVNLVVQGEIKSFVNLLDHKPLSLFSRTETSKDIATGVVSGKGIFEFPIEADLSIKDVQFSALVNASQVRTQQFQGGVFESDNIVVEVNNETIKVWGDGQFKGVPINGNWDYQFDNESPTSPIIGTIVLSSESIERFDFLLPLNIFNGTQNAEFSLQFLDVESPSFEIKINASSSVFGTSLFHTNVNEDIQIFIGGELGKPIKLNRISLVGNQYELQGEATLNQDGSVDNAEFDIVKFSDWFNARLIYDNDSEYAVTINSGSINLAKAEKIKSGQQQLGRIDKPLRIEFDEVQLMPQAKLTDVKGTVEVDGELRGQFVAKMNQQTDVRISLMVDELASSILFNSDDAGSLLRSANILDNLYGGEIAARITSVEGGSQHQILLQINDTRAQQLPVLGEILNIASIIGLLDQLNGDGILFSEVQAEILIDGDRIEFKQAFASGPSLGLTLEGMVDQGRNYIDLKGVITPFNVANEILLLTPLRAFGLDKGDGVGAISYYMRGAAENPITGVKPLTALTPGIFKKIFN